MIHLYLSLYRIWRSSVLRRVVFPSSFEIACKKNCWAYISVEEESYEILSPDFRDFAWHILRPSTIKWLRTNNHRVFWTPSDSQSSIACPPIKIKSCDLSHRSHLSLFLYRGWLVISRRETCRYATFGEKTRMFEESHPVKAVQKHSFVEVSLLNRCVRTSVQNRFLFSKDR